MKTFYCTVAKPSSRLLLNIHDVKAITPYPQFEAQSLEDFNKLISDHRVEGVMFYFFGWPRRPVGVTSPKLQGHLKRLIKLCNKTV